MEFPGGHICGSNGQGHPTSSAIAFEEASTNKIDAKNNFLTIPFLTQDYIAARNGSLFEEI